MAGPTMATRHRASLAQEMPAILATNYAGIEEMSG